MRVTVEPGPPDAPVALLAHGAGSGADLLRRAFAGPLAAAGLRLVTWDQRPGSDFADHLADLDTLASRYAARVVGGVSLGAHAAVTWAAGRDLDGVLAALPAWTGPPDDVATLSAQAAAEIARDGLAPTLARATGAAVGWVGEELRRAWPAYGEKNLVAALRAVAASPAPDLDDLAGVTAPVGLVALTGDAFHPAAVAHRWAAALPRATVVELPIEAPAGDRAVLGRAAVDAWLTAAGGRPGRQAAQGSRLARRLSAPR